MPLNLGELGSFPVVDALPASGVIGQHAVLKNDGKAYQWNPNAGAWEQLGTGASGGGGGLETTPIGTILSYAGSIVPSGYLSCDGAAVSRTFYASLFAAIGTVYGVGDGSTTFNLPDLRGRVAIGAGQGVSLTNRVLGAPGGEENHTLSIAEMPSHNHGGVTGNDSPDHTHALPATTVWQAGAGGNLGTAGSYNVSQTSTGGASNRHTHSVSSQGGGASHNVMQPFVTTNYMIKAAAQPAGQQMVASQAVVPMCVLYRTGGMSVPNATWTGFSFLDQTAELVDTDGMYTPATSSTRVTIRTPGVYQISAWSNTGASNSSGERWMAVRVNGVDIEYDNRLSVAQGALGNNISFAYKLNAGDYIEMFVYNNSGVTFSYGGRLSVVWSGPGLGIVGEQPVSFCRLQRSTALSLVSGTGTLVSWDTEVNDTDSMHDQSVNPTRITIRTPGVYAVLARAQFALSATGVRGLSILRNGVAVAENESTPNATVVHGMDVETTIACNAGDYLEVIAVQNSGGALNLNAAISEFSAMMVGSAAKAVVPTAQGYRTATLAVTQNVFTAVPLSGVESDNDSMWSAGAPSRYTVKTPGTYVIKGQLLWNTSLGANFAAAMIRKNGILDIGRQDLMPGTTAARVMSVTAIADLAAGDYIELIALQASTGVVNLDPQGFGTWSARFEMVKVASTGPTPETAPSTVSLDSWHTVGAAGEPAYTNSWVPFGTGYLGAAFTKDPFGRVRIRGIIKGGAAGSTAFTLPPGYRPAATGTTDHSFAAVASGGDAQVAVYPDGRVVPINVAASSVNAFVYLETIDFDTGTVTEILTGPKGDKGDTGGTTKVFSLGDGINRSFAFQHDLNSKAVTVNVYRTDTGAEVEAEVFRTSDKIVTVVTSAALPPPAVGEYTVAIGGPTSTTLNPVSLDPWHVVGAAGEPSFGNSWVAWGTDEPIVAFRKGPDGKVLLRGGVKGGTQSNASFTLPVGYRPAQHYRHAIPTNIGSSQLEISVAGAVYCTGSGVAGAPGYYFFDGVEFDTDTVTEWPVIIPPSVPTVTSLPAGATDGQEVDLVVDTAGTYGGPYLWRCKYRTSTPGLYKWHVIGEPPGLFIETTAAVGNISATTPTGTSSGGALPNMTLPSPGDWDVSCYASQLYKGGAIGYGYLGVAIAGVNAIVADAIVQYGGPSGQDHVLTQEVTRRKTVASTLVLQMQGWVTGGNIYPNNNTSGYPIGIRARPVRLG